MTSIRTEGRSLFWPLVLIGVGLIWLLSNLGVLQPGSIAMLFRLWPLILIFLGVEILLGRSNPSLRNLIGLVGVAAVIILMLLGPSLGWVRSVEIEEASYHAEVGDAASASIVLDVSVGSAVVQPLADSTNLFEADVRYIGDLEFNVSGESEKTVTLRQQDDDGNFSFGFNFFDPATWVNTDQGLRWDVGLSTDVPLNLTVNSGVSDANLNLRDLQLTGLRVSSGVGSLDLSLPGMEQPYNVSLSGGTGSMNVVIEEGAAINFDVDGGVGDVVIDVPEGAAVRVDASTGVGSISIPGGFTRVSGSDDNVVGDSGVWESEGFDSAERQIIIEFDGGVGGLTIR